MKMQGPASAVFTNEEAASQYRPDRWASLVMSSRSHTIWGGTAEIQRNIAGECVLGLPKEPSAESDDGTAA